MLSCNKQNKKKRCVSKNFISGLVYEDTEVALF